MSPSPKPPLPRWERPGRKLGPISDSIGSVHRAWLEPMHDAYLASELTLVDLSERVRLAKSKLSELLRGEGRSPRWENIWCIARVLEMPTQPLHRLWIQAAHEAQKSRRWITACTAKTAVTTGVPPVHHGAFRELTQDAYRDYAGVFLNHKDANAAVGGTYDILWLRWSHFLSQANTSKAAWKVLRDRVMARAQHRSDGAPEFTQVAFGTVALQTLTSDTARVKQIEESMALFEAMGHLPDHQLDVMVLRRLLGMKPDEASSLLGVPTATVHSDERHASRYLESVLCPPQGSEGTAP